MKKTLLGLIVCMLLLLPTAGWAQSDALDFGPWWEGPVVRDLGLSGDQMRQVQAIVRESRDPLIQLRASVRMAEGALADQMMMERLDRRKAEEAIDRVVAARGELMRTTSLMSLRLRQVLTLQQWQELRKRSVQRLVQEPQRRLRGRGGL